MHSESVYIHTHHVPHLYANIYSAKNAITDLLICDGSEESFASITVQRRTRAYTLKHTHASKRLPVLDGFAAKCLVL